MKVVGFISWILVEFWTKNQNRLQRHVFLTFWGLKWTKCLESSFWLKMYIFVYIWKNKHAHTHIYIYTHIFSVLQGAQNPKFYITKAIGKSTLRSITQVPTARKKRWVTFLCFFRASPSPKQPNQPVFTARKHQSFTVSERTLRSFFTKRMPKWPASFSSGS